MPRRRKYLIGIVAVFVVIGLAQVIGGSDEPTDSGTSAPAASAPAPAPAPACSERTRTFSVRGDGVITITLLEGLTLIDASHRGNSNFVV